MKAKWRRTTVCRHSVSRRGYADSRTELGKVPGVWAGVDGYVSTMAEFKPPLAEEFREEMPQEFAEQPDRDIAKVPVEAEAEPSDDAEPAGSHADDSRTGNDSPGVQATTGGD